MCVSRVSEGAICEPPELHTGTSDDRWCACLSCQPRLSHRKFYSGTVTKPAKANLLFDQMNNAQELWSRYFGDLQRFGAILFESTLVSHKMCSCWWVIALAGIVVALILGFTWLVFLKYCTAVMVYFTIFIVVVGLFALSLFCYFKAGILDASTVTSFSSDSVSNSKTLLTENLNASEVPLGHSVHHCL